MRPDTSITFLKSFGYTVLRMPRADTKPLQILSRQGKDLDRLGDLADVMDAGTIPAPPVSPDNLSPAISGKESSKVDLTIGVNILGNIISAMGGQNLGIQAGFKDAKTLTFQFGDVIENSVAVAKLEQFLNAAKIKPENSQGMRDRLIKDEIYVITSTIKSKKFIVDAQSERGATVAVDVPVISQAVGGSVKVDSGGDLTTKTAFEGGFPLVFGVQAVRLFFNDAGQFTTSDPLKAGDAALRGEEDTPPVTFLELPGVFAQIDDKSSLAAGQ